MLYTIIKAIAVLSLERFFDRIVVENREGLPEGVPTIFVANHPNTMMDALTVGYSVGRRLSFVGKSTLFSGKITSWFLSRSGLVPIYRREDDPTQTDRNEEVFRKLYDLLENKGSFLIFPEGISKPARKIQPVKTGAARIALGAEEKHDFRLGVQIVPVGLNYTDYQRFRSDVYCRFGKPIVAGEYKERYQKDSFQAVLDMTEEIRSRLEKVTTHVGEESLTRVISNLETVYKKELMTDLGMEEMSLKDDFLVTKGIINAVEWFHEHQPERVRQIAGKINNYLSTLRRLHLKDEFLSTRERGIRFMKRFRAWMLLIIGFPVFLWGLANNIIPYVIPRWYVHRFTKQKTFVSTVKLLVGLGSFILFYTLQSFLFWNLFHSPWLTTLYAITLVPSGNFSLYYLRKASKYRQHLLFLSLFYRRRILIYELIRKRMRLIESLNRARDEYLTETQASQVN